MPPRKDANRPKGRMSSYVYFVQACRDDHKKKHPGENVVFVEFSRKCAAEWKDMQPKDKKRFEDMADKDKIRHQREMSNYSPPPGEPPVRGGGGGKKRTKDPNAPKRNLSAFFMFCNEERPRVRKEFPDYPIGDVAKELGRLWGLVTDRTKFEKLAIQDKKRYEMAMQAYKAGGDAPAKAAAPIMPPAKKPRVEESDEEEDSDEEEEEEEEDDE